MTTRFISDLHLDPKRPEITDGFFAYLDRIQSDTSTLYILGDLFETWIGDDDDSPFVETILNKLRLFSASGVSTYVMHGNRDFLMQSRFCQRSGTQLIPDPYEIETPLGKIQLLHGDSLCTDDTDYQAFKAKIRAPESIAFLLSQPLEVRRSLAQSIRASAKEASSDKASEIMDVNQASVKKTFIENKIKLMIHGHTHRPYIHQYHWHNEPFTRFVLGDWGKEGFEIIINNNNISLKAFLLEDPNVVRTLPTMREELHRST